MLSAGEAERTALPPLPAQLAAMLADSDTETDAADALELIEALAAGAPEVLSSIQAQPVRSSGSIMAAVRAYPAQATAARAVEVQSSFQSMMRGEPQGLQGGLQEELHGGLQGELHGGLQWELQDIMQDLQVPAVLPHVPHQRDLQTQLQMLHARK